MKAIFGWVHFNDRLAFLLLIAVVPALWILMGLGTITLPGEITGVTIAGWTLILQYYFRKPPPENGNHQ